MAGAYHRLNNAAKAEETYLRAVALRPRNWLAYSSLGAFYYQTGKYREAEQSFQRVVALSPDSWRGYSNLGGVQYVLGRPREAIAAYETSMSLRANYAAASNLGTLYFYELADYPRAVEAFQSAIAIDDTRYDLWGNLGFALHWAGEKSRARVAFEKATTLAEASLRVNRRDAGVLMAAAEYYAGLGNVARARELSKLALSAAPENPRVLYKAGVLNETTFGDRAAALDLLNRALDRGSARKELERDPSLAQLRADGGLARLRPQGAPGHNQ
jgi:tetratricopeptide (TPR) repeat protein